MAFHIIIPARYGSTRLPGKPLLDIAGKPMIQRVYESCKTTSAESVTVATDDRRIADVVQGFGGAVVITATEHESGTDRIAEAVTILGLADDVTVVNVQGDEPDMPPALIEQLAIALERGESVEMATASAPIDDTSQLQDPSVVKVVVDRNEIALYFSRSTIPWQDYKLTNNPAIPTNVRRHLGIYAYRAGYIKSFAARLPCELERLERLEQLRALWYGERIRCIQAIEIPGPGIDTATDLERVREQFQA